MVSNTATVVRGDKEAEVSLKLLVPAISSPGSRHMVPRTCGCFQQGPVLESAVLTVKPCR